jgi:hypothetical protein
MQRFFDKRATVVDVTDKEVIGLFQDGLYNRRTFEDFGRRRSSSITKIKYMITSWVDEEDKANASTTPFAARARTTRAVATTTTGIKRAAATKTTRVLTASASQTTQSRLSGALFEGGSRLNVLFTKTLKKMKLNITHMLIKSTSPFYGIVPGNAAIPLGSVVLPVTFGETRENYRTEYIKFEVADFETSYHAILGRPAIAKFMVVPHYTYLVLKMSSPAGVLSLHGDLEISFDCDTEGVELATTNQVPNAMMEIYAASKKLAPTEPEIPEKSDTANKPQPSKEVQFKVIDLGTGDSSKTTMIGASLDPK